MLRQARAVMVCPRVFKAGFFFGGEGGNCVLAARDASGSWSYPAFYAMGSGSFGLQIGIQDAQFIMMILTDKGLSAIMDNQFKIGGDASIAVATLGAGVQGDTTAGLGADIVAYTQARGLYGGISAAGQHHGAAHRVEPRLLRPARLGCAADRHPDAGDQSRRRPAAPGADPLRRRDAARPGRRHAAAGARDGADRPAGRAADAVRAAPGLGRDPAAVACRRRTS